MQGNNDASALAESNPKNQENGSLLSDTTRKSDQSDDNTSALTDDHFETPAAGQGSSNGGSGALDLGRDVISVISSFWLHLNRRGAHGEENSSWETPSQFEDASSSAEWQEVGLQVPAMDLRIPLLPREEDTRPSGRFMFPFDISELSLASLPSLSGGWPGGGVEGRKRKANVIFLAKVCIVVAVAFVVVRVALPSAIKSRRHTKNGPSQKPTLPPALSPSAIPTRSPSPKPTDATPTQAPTPKPTPLPSPVPSPTPTLSPEDQRFGQVLYCASKLSNSQIIKGNDPIRWKVVQYFSEGDGTDVDANNCENPRSFFSTMYSMIVIRESLKVSNTDWFQPVADLHSLCKWARVACSSDGGEPAINQLSFNNAGLSGTIPPEIKGLWGLQNLYAYSNPGLVGTLPTEMGLLQNLQ